MQPSNAHVVRFIELGPELNAGAGGLHRRQETVVCGVIADFHGRVNHVNNHEFGSPCHNLAPRPNPRRNAANSRQTTVNFLRLGDEESD
jgi:hypothetical protein